MSNKNRRKSKDYKAAAKRIREFVPAAQHWDLRRKLTPHQKAWISRYEKVITSEMAGARNYVPLSPKEYRRLKAKESAHGSGGVYGIRLRNTSKDAKVRVSKDGNAIVVSNGRRWKYERVEPVEVEVYIDAGIRILRRKNVVQIHLWTTSGRASRGFTGEKNWAAEIAAAFAAYKRNPEEFMLGVAYLVQTKKKNRRN